MRNHQLQWDYSRFCRSVGGIGARGKSISEQFKDLSTDQKKYANSLLRAICQKSCKLPDPYKTVSLIENNSIRKRMFYCAMELIFLYNNSFGDDSQVQFATDLFDFGRKVVSDTKASIEREYHVRGTSGISEQFGNTEDESFSDEFFCDFVEFDTNNSSEKECVFLEQGFDIPQGKQRTFKNSEVTVGSFINCSGVLYFENCHIIFGSGISKDGQIVLNDGSEIHFENCTFTQKHLTEPADETPLPFMYQPDTSNIKISICKSTFNDCGYVFGNGSAASNSQIELTGCHIINPLWKFLDVSTLTGKIESSRITIIDHTEWAKQLDNHKCNSSGGGFLAILRRSGGDIFASSSIGEEGFFVKDCIAEAGGDLSSKDVNLFSLGGSYLDQVGVIFENCTFINLSNCISEAKMVIKSNFNNCHTCISKLSQSLVDSVFYRVVSAVSSIEEKATVVGCQFLECGGDKSLIETGFYGDVSIEYCQFVNIEYITGTKWKDRNGMLSFKRCKGRGYKSTVSRCQFVSLYSDKGYIISCPIIEKTNTPFVKLVQCRFSQCGTGEGELLQESSFYLGLFNRKTTVGGLVDTENCSGEKENCREYKPSQGFSPRTESRSGERIGSTLLNSPEITYTPILDNIKSAGEAIMGPDTITSVVDSEMKL